MDSIIKISKKDFADTLYYWLSEHLTEKEVMEMANEVGFKMKGFFRIKINKKSYNKFYGELFVLNMYLIVSTCEGIIKDENKKNDILEIFHSTVYERNIKATGISYSKWMKLMKLIYDDYSEAMGTESLLTPLLLVAGKFEKNLFGKNKLNPYVKFEFAMRIGGMVKHLSKSLQEYDIEEYGMKMK